MLTVDTLKAYESLIAADVPERQAKAILELVKTSQEAWLEKLATKEDLGKLKEYLDKLESRLKVQIAEIDPRLDVKIANLRTELKADISTLRGEMREMEGRLEAKIEAAGKNLLKWFIPIILGQTAYIFTLLKVVK